MKIIRQVIIDDDKFVSSDVPETDYTAYSAATTYALDNRVIVVGTNEHRVYESLQNSNIAHTPLTSPTWWLNVSATNRWKMFDELMNSQTSQANSIEVTVNTGDERADTVTLLNVSAATVQVTVTDTVDGLVYDETVNMIFDSGITDWYAYFFEPIVRRDDVFFSNIPPYTNADIVITLLAPGETVLCGLAVIGLSKEIGATQYGAQVGIQDYSVKTIDDFGNYTILERAFANRASFTVIVQPAYVDALKKLLISLRATPTLYIGSDSFTSTVVYGFYRDFNVEIAYWGASVCTLELEGLT